MADYPKVYIVPTLNEAMGICSVCGVKDEVRPYGKGGANVCYDCGMLDEKEAKKQFLKQFK